MCPDRLLRKTVSYELAIVVLTQYNLARLLNECFSKYVQAKILKIIGFIVENISSDLCKWNGMLL